MLNKCKTMLAIRKPIFFAVFYLSFNISLRTVNARTFLNLEDPHVSHNYYRNIIDKIDHDRQYRKYDDIDFISKALEIINQEESGITALQINKCLNTHLGKTKKFNCIKKIIYKDETEKNDENPNLYKDFLNKERLRYKKKNNFKDLINYGSENDANRMFEAIIHFSQDYLDIDDLFKDEKAQNKEELHISETLPIENNYFRGLPEFSQDYLDPSDLWRRYTKIANKEASKLNNTKNTKKLYVFKLIPNKNEVHEDLTRLKTKIDDENPKETSNKSNLHIFKLLPNKNKLKDLRRFGSKIVKDDLLKKKILKTIPVDSDSSSSSDESSSKEGKLNKKTVRGKDKNKKFNRFEVIDRSEDKSTEENNLSNESDIPIQRPIEIPKRDKKVYYMQAPSRILKIRNEGRRRLPHFLPKRYHWPLEDMTNLQYYWFSGRQGKYWGPHKTPY